MLRSLAPSFSCTRSNMKVQVKFCLDIDFKDEICVGDIEDAVANAVHDCLWLGWDKEVLKGEGIIIHAPDNDVVAEIVS